MTSKKLNSFNFFYIEINFKKNVTNTESSNIRNYLTGNSKLKKHDETGSRNESLNQWLILLSLVKVGLDIYQTLVSSNASYKFITWELVQVVTRLTTFTLSTLYGHDNKFSDMFKYILRL